MIEQGKTKFLDGMRVAREHLDHMQDLLLTAVIQLRQTIGSGKVCYGLKTETISPDKVKVESGLAFDKQGRPLYIEQDRDLNIDFGAGKILYLVLKHTLRSEGALNGIPTILHDDVELIARSMMPPYQDDAVIFAELHLIGDKIQIIQKGEWYLPPLNHGHSGQFKIYDDAKWRYDGPPMGFSAPAFDSGFITITAGSSLRLVHDLNSLNLLVTVYSRLENGVITTKGFGHEYWYEIPNPQEIRLIRGNETEDPLDIRVVVWRFGEAESVPVLPVADAGDDFITGYGMSFTLDGSRSRGFMGRKIIRYLWTQLT